MSAARVGLAAALLPALFAGPAAATPPAPPPAASQTAVTETIDETTVGDLDGVRVPMGNMTTGAYTLPDGTEKTGPICSLALPGGPVFVGVGSVVTVGGARWEVTAVDKTPGELGSVTLTRR